MGDVRIFGIRHHGPGSARSLARALDLMRPDCVLIEGPPDADAMIAAAGRPGLVPPVALVVYRPDRPRDCAFFPFAAFSPEWVAMRRALDRGVPVRFIDLPHAVQLADGFGAPPEEPVVPAEPPAILAAEPGDVPAEPDDVALPLAQLRRDPLGELARAAGLDDGERWWDLFVESRAEHGEDVFGAITEAMAALREAKEADIEADRQADRAGEAPGWDERREELREEMREAHMRQAIRQAAKDGAERVAVVCGAWHAPALARHAARGQAGLDAATLRGLARTKTACAWAPWSYDRLATASGYPAGVLSPEWYDTLWHHGEQDSGEQDSGDRDSGDRVAALWLARAAALLRAADLDASPASVIEAVRLAAMLAGVRGRSRPALEDLDEAAAATLCFADPAPMALIRRRLVIGERLGAVPPDAAGTPVEADFAAQCRRLRMAPEAGNRDLELDLRKEGDLARSHFLNRLALIGIPWGEKRRAGGRGTFREMWHLGWRPEWVVDLVAASAEGGTVADAAAARVRRRAAEATRVAELSALIATLLDADLGAAAAEVVQALDDRAAVSADVFDLMAALPALAELARYGSVRSHETEPVKRIVRGIVPRVAAGLAAACQSLDDDAARAARGHVEAVSGAVALLEEDELKQAWRRALRALADQGHVHGLVTGRAVRLLFDAGVFDAAETGRRLGLALGRASGALPSAAFLAGVLEGGGTALIHGAGLLAVVDDWLAGLDAALFTELLPLVRRTFATMERPERRIIGEMLRRPGGASPADGDPGRGFDAERAALVLPMLRLLLAEPAAEGTS